MAQKRKKVKRKGINLLASFDDKRKCFDIYTDGSCYLKLHTSKRELAKVLRAFDFLKTQYIKVSLRGVGKLDETGKSGRWGGSTPTLQNSEGITRPDNTIF